MNEIIQSELHGKFLNMMMAAAWTDCSPPSKRTRRGKTPDRPRPNGEAHFECVKFLHRDFNEILKRNNAPDGWQDAIGFLVACLLFPQRVNGATLKNGILTVRHNNIKNEFDEAVLNAANFARLYSESPRIFLNVLTEMENSLQKRLQSPETLVAAVHIMSRRAFALKSGELASRISSKHCPVTAKVVEHARQAVRKYFADSLPRN